MKSKVTIEVEVDEGEHSVTVNTTTDPELPSDTKMEDAHKAGQLAFIAGMAIREYSASKCPSCAIEQLDHLHLAADIAHDRKADIQSWGSPADVPDPTKH